ncbi:magnesium transporter [Proteiniclasticum sp. BAD-10]|uniref:Magnesium transporter MgtE n=1 Tax=Proteiniclasticum sediminis TaxID=2804028 RepID=A0A941HPT5_9CLOT|nr:magnesium transporter [Proteiniclasticum sediminis]MBR0575365.1 magnesium transporter [Proteiniclasticum sediminis]
MKRDEELIRLILDSPIEEILILLDDLHPVDVLEALQAYEGNPMDLLEKLPDEYIAMLIDEAEDDEKYDILTLFPQSQQKNIIEEMSSDELADLLGSIDTEDQDTLLESMDKEDREEMKELLSYSPETAGGIMATEFISVKESMTIDDTLQFLRSTSPDAETPYYLYVLNDQNVLRGIVPIRDIITSPPDALLRDIMSENITAIPVEMDQEEVSNIFQKYGYMAMPVVDPEGVMLGVITVDDVMEVLTEEHTEDMYRLAGLDEEEVVDGTVRASVQSRLPWLLVNLLTAILASAMVSLFDDTIGKVVALAVFMPMVTGMGGNAGTQTLTLMIRGLAIGQLTPENARQILRKEFGVGVIHGLVLGLIVFVMGSLWEHSLTFGMVIGIAMFLNMIVATMAGYLIPLLLRKLGVDPALASGVFVTTMTDTLGFFFFLGLATLLIEYLI